ncbi:MAG: 3-oxoacyl-ACP synthase, partial [Bacteroidota bacterium]
AHCEQHIEERVTSLQSSLTDIETSRNNETKSSAGDKFETGRAMMQIEAAKLQRQLTEVLKLRQAIDQIKRHPPAENVIGAGSLVATNRGLYFLAIGIGKVKLEGRTIFCTSLEAPIGSALLGKRVGETFSFNDLEFLIKGIV